MFEILAFVSIFLVVTLLVTSVFHRLIKSLLAFTLFFTFALGDALPILASSDITQPTVKSISFDKAIVQAGEELHIQVEAEDLDSGVNQLYVILKRAIGGVRENIIFEI
ncbi:hypothetical protein [Neobacillus drentensis]|uniref:hypothetical protein n=1 Tax=Neobacillus drentensis TaxID=220684 RepID=UPI0030017EE3